jgi:putative transposase
VCPITAPTFSPLYSRNLHRKPKRFYGTGHLHFITCSCYQHRPLLGTQKHRDLFLTALERVRKRYQFVVVGYVVMPEHIHLLISEPERKPRSTVMQALKPGLRVAFSPIPDENAALPS